MTRSQKCRQKAQKRIKLVSQGVYHYNKYLDSLCCDAEGDYFGAGKIKCGISNADAERPVA